MMNLAEYEISEALVLRVGKIGNLEVTRLYGYCPVQSEGMLDGMEYYFRSRDDHWRIEAGTGRSSGQPPTWWHSEIWPGEEFAAGWMTDEEAIGCIAKAAETYNSLNQSRFVPGHPDYERTVYEGWSMRALRLVDVMALLRVAPQDAAPRAAELHIQPPWTAANELDWIIKTGFTN